MWCTQCILSLNYNDVQYPSSSLYMCACTRDACVYVCVGGGGGGVVCMCGHERVWVSVWVHFCFSCCGYSSALFSPSSSIWHWVFINIPLMYMCNKS